VPAHTTPLIKMPGLKTVMVVHDLGAEYLPGTHQLKQRLYLKAITKYQLKTATKLIAVSESTKKDLVSKVGIRSENIKVIYEGLDSNQYTSVNDDALINILNRYVLKKRKYFLFVGTIQPRKNLARLIQAFNDFSLTDKKDINLVLAGSKGWLSEEIYALPKTLGIEKKVKFLGHVPDEDLSGIYSGALAFVFPSLFEGFGLPVLEAMACGVPVITSDTSSMPEVAGNAALLINPESGEEIAKSLKKIAENSVLREEMIIKGFKQVKKFSWEKCARETLDFFREVGGQKT
jgi:glycosyltransferase involved in cell wall biosynthesis